MLTSLVLLENAWLKRLDHVTTSDRRWVSWASYHLQLLVILDQMFLSTSTTLQKSLQTHPVLASDLNGLVSFNYKDAKNITVVGPKYLWHMTCCSRFSETHGWRIRRSRLCTRSRLWLLDGKYGQHPNVFIKNCKNMVLLNTFRNFKS